MQQSIKYLFNFLKLGCGVHLFANHVGFIHHSSGESMLPTLDLWQNWILIDKSLISPWKPGDVVMARSPTDPNKTIAKRLIGLPGDVVLINPIASSDNNPREHYQVPPGHVWLAGDNLSNSIDSSSYGPVPIGLLKGKVIARVLSLSLS